MKTRVLSVILATFCTSASFSQVSTILVTVSDTIMVPSNRIQVMISFEGENGNEGTFDDEGNFIPTENTFAKETALVERILDSRKILWKKAGDQPNYMPDYYRYAQSPGNNILVEFNSKAQLEQTLPELKAVPFVKTTEISAQVDENRIDMAPLYAKLLKNARTKAEMIAGLSGKKVGTVFQIGSPCEGLSPDKYLEQMSDNGYMGSILQILNTATDMSTGYKVSVSESLTVSFYLLDK